MTIIPGRAPIPKTMRTNWRTATFGTSAPISIAIRGVSLTPPGIEQSSEVSRSSGVVHQIRKPISRLVARKQPITTAKGLATCGR